MIEITLKENVANCDVYVDDKFFCSVPYLVINEFNLIGIGEEVMFNSILTRDSLKNMCVKDKRKITDQFVYKRV